MNSWRKVKLSDILTLERRPVDIDPQKEYKEIGIYCFGKGVFHKPPRFGYEIGEKSLFLLKEGDFIFQITFAWEGAVALMSKDEDGMCASTRFPTFRVNKDLCVPEFLLFFPRSKYGLQELIKISPGSAGRNRVLNIKRFSEVIVHLPSLSEQQRIVKRVEELLVKMKEEEQLKTKTVKEVELFIDVEIKRVLNILTQNKNIEYAPISKCVEINPPRKNDFSFSDNDFVSFVPMSAIDINTGSISERKTRRLYEVKNGYTCFNDGDVIFAKITPCMENGKSAIVTNLENGIGFGSTEFHVLRPSSNILAEWLHLLIKTKEFRNEAKLSFKGTAGQQRVPQSYLENKIIPIPSINEQERLVNYFNKINIHVNDIRKINTQINNHNNLLFKSVLENVFKGKLN